MPTRLLEMFGMAAVEAQACGKPVIASDSGGLREVVPDRLRCSVSCRRHSPSWRKRSRNCVDNPDRHAMCSANALRNAANYRWGAICDSLEGLYALNGGEP